MILALWVFAVASSATTDADIERLAAEERALAARKATQSYVLAALDHIEQQRRAVAARLAELADQRTMLEAERQHLAHRLDETAMSYHHAAKRAGQRLALLARSSRAWWLELLLTARDPADFVYRYHALRAVVAADKRLLTSLTAQKSSLAELQQRLLEYDRHLAALEARGRLEATRLEALEKVRGEQATSLRREIKEREAWIAAMRAAVQRLDATVVKLAPTGRAKPNRVSKLTPPVAGDLVETFGQPGAFTGALLPSQGWRFRAAEGSPVRAVASGIVAYADWFQGYGNLVILDHGGGVASLYAHMATTSVYKGQWVEAGHIIGAAGTSGSVYESGLYFEMRYQGKPIDPATWPRVHTARPNLP